MKRTFLALALCLNAAAAAADRLPIQVGIENRTGQTIRCVAVLAHFVTRSLPPIPDGESAGITLTRNLARGTLVYGWYGDHPMMLENLLCGAVEDWTVSARDLPILQLRAHPTHRFDYRCVLARRRVVCSLPRRRPTSVPCRHRR